MLILDLIIDTVAILLLLTTCYLFVHFSLQANFSYEFSVSASKSPWFVKSGMTDNVVTDEIVDKLQDRELRQVTRVAKLSRVATAGQVKEASFWLQSLQSPWDWQLNVASSKPPATAPVKF